MKNARWLRNQDIGRTLIEQGRDVGVVESVVTTHTLAGVAITVHLTNGLQRRFGPTARVDLSLPDNPLSLPREAADTNPPEVSR